MIETVGRPAYQQVADDLRHKIASAELQVGAAIPSTAQLTRAYGVSSTVARAAVNQLRADGLLVGQPGKGVFVCSTPDAAAQRASSIEDLARQVTELRAALTVLATRHGHVEAQVAELRQQVLEMEAELTTLRANLSVPKSGAEQAD